MPPRNPNKGIRKHGTLDGQQTNIEAFKNIRTYKKLIIINDNISNRITELFNNNHWDLKLLFKRLKDHYKELGIPGLVAWDNDIQLLDHRVKPIARPKKYLSKFLNGDYKSIGTYKKPNSLETEKTYAKRIIFFAKTFPDFHKFINNDDLQWTVDNNRLLFYNILKYHSDKKQTLSAINRDLKVLIRVYRLLLGDGIDNELKYKYSALQIAITDLNNYIDDFNNIESEQELNSFIPYEQLLDICDNLEKEYFKMLNKLPSNIRKNGKKHPVELFQLHQLFLAFAINVWNFPSRSENYELIIIKKPLDIYKKANYVIVNDDECWLIYNEVKKTHKPIKYQIKSSHISALNIRLCNLLRFSLKTYDRPFLFVNSKLWFQNKIEQISHSTVSMWVRDYISSKYNVINKNIGINVFRSAFVSYYFPRFNNRGKNILRIRMRTSIDSILRSYLKIYNNPDILAKVTLFPNKKLFKKVAKGHIGNEIVIDDDRNLRNMRSRNNANLPDEKIVPYINLSKDPIIKLHNMRNSIFRKWLRTNLSRFRQYQKNPNTYAKRYVRELNKGKITISQLQKSTIERYKIFKRDGVFYSELLM